MRHTASSHRQMKALFFILLLAGHDAVRVTQEAEWSKSKWNELHADCSWSLGQGCSEGCVRKRLPLDLPGQSCRHTNAYLLEHNGLENYHAMIDILIEKSEKNLGEVKISSCRLLYSEKCQKASGLNRKCRRREVQMSEAFQFIIRAYMNETFIATLDESEQATLHEGLQKVLKNLASSQEEAESMAELMKKMKCQKSELLRDPKKAMAEVAGLGQALLSDNQTVKQQAKLQIDAMPESCSPVSADEEAEGLVKLKDLQKDFQEEPGEVEILVDDLDAAVDHVVEEEAEGASSALQVNVAKAAAAPIDKLAIPGALVGAIYLSIFVATLPWAIAAFPIVLPVALLVSFLVFLGGYFGVCEVVNEFSGGEYNEACLKTYLLLPFRIVKGLVKGAAYLGKGIYKHFKGNSNKTSVLLETEAFMDELPELQAEAAVAS
eukprot:Skav206726  [mRNA]  locus=scaffold967:237054:239118:- [translate_table: standard]